MMTQINLNHLTAKQYEVWIMRFRHRWRLKTIALRMGTTPQAVSALIQRAQRSAGLPGGYRRVDVIRSKPRKVRAMSLSDACNY